MKVHSRLIALAGIGLLVAFASNAFAQAGGRAGSPPSRGPWTANNVTAERPFGNIDISRAGGSPDSVRTWSQGRSAFERDELNGRCEFITTPANAARYRQSDQQFCRNYMMVGSARRISPSPRP